MKFARHVPFTAGDLSEGLGFMEPVQRRAVLFGLDQGIPSTARVASLTHDEVAEMRLSEFARAVLEGQPRHARIKYVFWQLLSGGLVAPLVGLDDAVRSSFGGMSWADLLRCYRRMLWIDDEIESEVFERRMQQISRPS